MLQRSLEHIGNNTTKNSYVLQLCSTHEKCFTKICTFLKSEEIRK